MDSKVFLHDWSAIANRVIITGTDNENKPYLKQFLTDYVKYFEPNVNPNCTKCLNEYINTLKNDIMFKKINPEKPESNFKLLKKRENLPLEFGSDVLVNNDNITDEYAVQLFNRLKSINPDLAINDVFSKYPEDLKGVDVSELKATEVKAPATPAKDGEPAKRTRRTPAQMKADAEQAVADKLAQEKANTPSVDATDAPVVTENTDLDPEAPEASDFVEDPNLEANTPDTNSVLEVE